jgi:hypothetical protein
MSIWPTEPHGGAWQRSWVWLSILTMTALPVGPAVAQAPIRIGAVTGVSAGYDSNVDHRFDAVAAPTVAATGEVELRRRARRTDLRLLYAVTHQRHELETVRTRTTHDARLTLGYSPNRQYSFAINFDSSIGGLSEDRELGTQHGISPRVDVRLGERNRLRMRSIHRLRRFGERSGRDAINHGAGIDYRIGPNGRPTLEFATRYDQTSTDDLRSRFKRWSHRVTFSAPLARNTALSLGARQTTRTYPHRLVQLEPIAELDLLPEEREILEQYTQVELLASIPLDSIPDELLLRWRNLARRDEIWAPYAALTFAPGGFEVRIAYDLEVRLSNDLRRGYSAHSVEVGTRWRLR